MTKTTGTTTSSRGGADPIEEGVRLGIERLVRYGVYQYADTFETMQLVRSVLGSVLSGAPDRVVELMAEQVTVAVLIRREYDEPQLTDEQVAAYMNAAAPFFNSLWHDPP